MRVLALIAMLVPMVALADPPADVKALDGNWVPTKVEILGREAPLKNFETTKLTIAGDTYSVTSDGTTDKGTVKTDATAKPATLDILGTSGPNKDKNIVAIWKLEGDKLQVCYNLDGKVRPTAFESTSANSWLLISYKRVK